MSWNILDVRKIGDHHPDFKLPLLEEVERLVPGDFAKLLFKFSQPNRELPDGERMWVQIMGRHEECGHWVGRLSNDPLHAPLKLGDDVEFGPEHILAFMKSDSAVVGREVIGWTKGDRNDPENWKIDPQEN
jgi:hypothetical protein